MKSRGMRVLLLVLAVAALAAAGGGVWRIEQRIAAARSAADTFDRDARQVVVELGDWRAAQQGYVAEGQPAAAWLTRAAGARRGHRAEALGACVWRPGPPRHRAPSSRPSRRSRR